MDRSLHLAAGLTALAACAEPVDGRPGDPGLTALGLRELAPELVLPGTTITIVGESFVDEPWGDSSLRLVGRAADAPVDVLAPARYIDAQTLELELGDEVFDILGGDGGSFEGTATVEVRSAVDGQRYRTTGLDVALQLRDELAPSIDSLLQDAVIFPNEPLAVSCSGLLLPGEGTTVAVVDGCFAPEGSRTCAAIAPVETAVTTAAPHDRTRGGFAFVPEIAGIAPGRFEGTVRLRNRHASGTVLDSPALPVVYDLQRPIIFGASTDDASLGEYVTITGGGFVGGEGSTLLAFTGTFTADDTGEVRELDEQLLPELVDGHTVRYVINEDDALGQLLDVRYEAGTFDGVITPSIEWRGTEVQGDPAPLSFHLAEVRQVVYVAFTPAYVESLRAFGMRAVDSRIRARVLEVIRRDFATIGVEVRDQPPGDFAYYAEVDVGGPDPNGLGLLGYDNTPGKDTGNVRLYDRIGGVNAVTQQDGYPGFGGVFIESLLGYSEHPGAEVMLGAPDPRFDRIFDPFRPDRGGDPVGAADLAAADVPTLADSVGCPAASDRALQIACAVWTLGSMIGSTVSHELGHSLGLADPYGPDFHDVGDADDRLMDADRPFAERAEIDGEGPSRFCEQEYVYLRAILPTGEPGDPEPRPPCS